MHARPNLPFIYARPYLPLYSVTHHDTTVLESTLLTYTSHVWEKTDNMLVSVRAYVPARAHISSMCAYFETGWLDVFVQHAYVTYKGFTRCSTTSIPWVVQV